MEHFKKSHYNLDELKILITNPKTRVITDIARKNAFSTLGLVTDEEIIEIVLALKKTDIFKTMTSHYNSKLWQDVYKPMISGKILYIKLQKSFEQKGVIIQFKTAINE